MSHTHEYDGQDDAQLGDQPEVPLDTGLGAEGQVNRHAGLISWIASGSLHATMIMLMGTVYFLVQPSQDDDHPPFSPKTIPPPVAREVPPPKDRTLLENPVDLKLETTDTVAPVTELDLPIEKPSTEDEAETPALRGRPDAIADVEMGNLGLFMNIGAGASGAGAFGDRNDGGRKKAVGAFGGSKRSESAVNAALRWFKRHQSPNGMWDAERYFQNCTEDPKCEPGSFESHAAEQVNVAMTGYALLAFLGAGHDQSSQTTYKRVVKKGIDYLLSVQKPDGTFGSRNYEHAIATMAIAEAYAMSSDPILREPAQKGVDVILARQNRDDAANAGESGSGGLGWDYLAPKKRNDASVTGWNVMALKSARAAGLDVHTGITGAKAWLERAWKANNDGKEGRPDWQKIGPYSTDESRFSYTWSGSTEYVKEMGHQNMASVGLVCAVFLGHEAGDPMLESLANYVAKQQTPKSYPTNTYYLYYNTLGMFQVGGAKWTAWNGAVRDLLVNAQRKGDGCFDGSWDFEGTSFHGHKIGRVLSTAYCALSLEVYYRYAQLQAAAAAAAKGKPQAGRHGL